MGIHRQEHPTTDDVRIGNLLVQMGYLTNEQLAETLREQMRRENMGIQCTVGEICVEYEWCTMKDIAIAMKEQEEEVFRLSALGQILLNLGFVSPEELGRALEAHTNISAPIGEMLVELGFCTEDQIRVAMGLQILYRNGVLRRALISRYHPYNIMELVVNHEIDNVIAERGGCFCQECRANMFALAMNELPPRYVTDERLILTFTERYRAEYAELVRQTLKHAVDAVKNRPKRKCRGNRYRLDLERIAAAGEIVREVPVRITNRHVHLNATHLEALFGQDYHLTQWKELRQPGYYAAKEVVTLVGPKGRIEKVRVLGPVRQQTQVEICGTDQFLLGLRVPIRDSSNFEGTPGIHIIGPKGEIDLEHGVIRALRHIHISPSDAEKFGVSHHDVVDVRLNGERTTVCEGVLIRISETAVLEMHIDTDEAHAAGVPAESTGEILGPSFRSH